LRTSESKALAKNWIKCGFSSETRTMSGGARMVRVSEPPHGAMKATS
jgi:hypothetical protein